MLHSEHAAQCFLEAKRRDNARKKAMKIGGKYNWIGQRERLVYIGKNWSGNGYWHQFEKVDELGTVWCEVLDVDLHMIEETPNAELGGAEPIGEASRSNDALGVN